MRNEQDFRPVLESLEPRLMLSLTPEMASLLTPAQILPLQPLRSVSVNGLIASPTQACDYCFTAAASGQIVVSTTSWSRPLTLSLGVFDGSGSLVTQAASAPKSSVTALTFVAMKGQTYYLQATSANGGVGRFNMRAASTTADEYGDTFDTAKALTLSKTGAVSISGGIQFAGDVDMFMMTTTTRGLLNISLTRSGFGGNPLVGALVVYDANGNIVAHDDDAANTGAAVSFVVTAGQGYYIQVAGQGGTVGAYKLAVSTVADDYGDTFDTAKAVTLSKTGSGSINGGIQYTGDVDMFTMVATQTGTMTAGLALTGWRNGLSGELTAYDAAGNVLANNQTAQITFAVTAGQQYFVKADGLAGTVGTYRLTFATAAPPPAPTPPPTPTPTPDPTPTPTPDPTPTPTPDPTPTPTPPTYTPGATVTEQVVQQTDGQQLVVLGTDGADSITVSQTDTGLTVTTSLGTSTIQGTFASVVIYGFGGDDTINLAYSVTAKGTVYCGNGTDTIYDPSQGTGAVYGGTGNDTFVSIGGGAHSVIGGSGFDSFWADTSDTLTNVSAAETVAGNVHIVNQFYVPTTNGSGPVPLACNGQNLADPLTSYAYSNMSSQPLFVGGPQYNDIQQGNLGDCYFMASLASMAAQNPNIVNQLVTSLGDGTYAVRFYRNNQAVYVRVDGDLPVYSGTSLAYARPAADGAIWAPLVEKAYAEFRCADNNYNSLNGGWMDAVYADITNQGGIDESTSGTSAASLASFISSELAGGHVLTAGTNSTSMGPFVGGHAYMVKSIATISGTTYVTVYNPWGFDGASYDSNPSDGLLQVTLADFQADFMALAASVA